MIGRNELRIDGAIFQKTPVDFYVSNNFDGSPDKAIVFNPTNEHVLSSEETKEIIALLQRYVDSATVSDNSSSQG